MEELPKNHFGAILADPPWPFKTFSGDRIPTKGSQHYSTMTNDEIINLPVANLSSEDCVLFLWFTWPTLKTALQVIDAWGFVYKTCGFCWIKANGIQPNLFDSEIAIARRGMGYWTLSNSEACLLATKGKPKRLSMDVHQAIIAPRREHSRKPDGVHERIERLIAGPYLELFARQERKGWTVWGNETNKFKPRTEWDSMWSRPFDRPELVWTDEGGQ